MEVRATSSSSSISSNSSSECHVLCHELGLEHERVLDAFDIVDIPMNDEGSNGIAKKEEKRRDWKDVEMKPTVYALELQRCREDIERTRQLARAMVKKYRRFALTCLLQDHLLC